MRQNLKADLEKNCGRRRDSLMVATGLVGSRRGSGTQVIMKSY